MRAVLDTNVLVSALVCGGRLEEIACLVCDGSVGACFSDDTFSELVGVISRPKWEGALMSARTSVNEIVSTLDMTGLFYVVPDRDILPVVAADPTDDKFFACALASKADYLVSGDKLVLAVKKYHGTKVVSPKQFLTIIGSKKKA